MTDDLESLRAEIARLNLKISELEHPLTQFAVSATPAMMMIEIERLREELAQCKHDNTPPSP